MSKRLEELIKEKILIFDGAMGTYLSNFKIFESDFGGHEGLNEYLSISKPEIIKKIHLEYLSAGADVIETNTFGANRIVLSEYGLDSMVKEINLKSVQIAREAIKEYSTPQTPKFIAGSMGPTTKSIFVTRDIAFDEMQEAYFEQICSLMEGGVDILLFETAHDILNVKAGLKACINAFKERGRSVPVIVSVNMDANGLMLSGHDVEAAYVSLEHFPLFAMGFNCSTGPGDMRLRIETLSKISKFPVFVMPNAGLPDENGNYTETAGHFSEIMKTYAQSGFLNIAGGCCGTGPEHIRILREKLKNIKPRKIKTRSYWAVSGIEAFFYEQIKPPVLVGERNNSIGSKKFREIVSLGRWDEAVEMAKSQINKGAHLLDVCLSSPERNELQDAEIFLPKLFHSIRTPVMIDTTDEKVMETGLKLAPGKCILNSVNFEFGEEKAGRVAELAKTYGAKIVFGVIDENKERGMPITAERKVSIAQRGYEFFTKKCGLAPQDIIFDGLVFPVGVGGEYAESGMETLKAVESMKRKFPLSKTLLGISNVSFGLPPDGREILNSVFVHHGIKAGLDLAIVNVEKLKPYSSMPREEIKLAEDLLFARSKNAAGEFAEYFRNKAESRGQITDNRQQKAESRSQKPEVRSQKPEKKLQTHILEGVKSNIEEIVRELLKKKTAMDIINGPVLEAMAEVGKLFGNGEMIVTEMLQSAEVTQKIIHILEPALKSSDKTKRGKMLLATVKGDVHDIGKNIVGIIFESNGFEVIDLGVKVPPEIIVERSLKEKPDFIGLSGLLVRSIEQMRITASEIKKAGVSVPLIVGGAALTEKSVSVRIKPEYEGSVFYAPDAMEGLNIALKYKAEGLRLKAKGSRRLQPARNKDTRNKSQATDYELRTMNYELRMYPDEIPVPKDFERHLFKNYDLDVLFDHLNLDLFKMRFLKLKKTQQVKKAMTDKLIKDFKKEIIQNKTIKAAGVYKFYPVNSDGNKIIFYDREGKEIDVILFPRQTHGEKLSISDSVLPVSAGKRDFVAFFLVTCGQGIMEFSKAEREKGNFLKSYMAEALALSLTEAFAETIHGLIRKDWGIGINQGKRYSFGYPPCPDLSNQAKLFKLLKPEDIGVKLTENFMMEPEASVSGFVLHNPKAKYFNV